MKKVAPSAIILLFGFTALLPAAAQKHPPIAAAAHETSAEELHSALDQKEKILVIDVRTPAEFSRGHIPGAVNIPMRTLRAKIRHMRVSRDTTIVTMCDRGGRSSRAALELQKLGYRTASFCRIDDWRKDGYRIKQGGH